MAIAFREARRSRDAVPTRPDWAYRLNPWRPKPALPSPLSSMNNPNDNDYEPTHQIFPLREGLLAGANLSGPARGHAPCGASTQHGPLTRKARKSSRPTRKVYIYDTSGPYSDPNVDIDLKKGLPRLREPWILGRGDVERLPEISSEYGRMRRDDHSLDHLRFEHITLPLRAKAGRRCTQMHYAKQGIITPEMEYVAIRENMNCRETGHRHAYHARVRPPGIGRRTCAPACKYKSP